MRLPTYSEPDDEETTGIKDLRILRREAELAEALAELERWSRESNPPKE